MLGRHGEGSCNVCLKVKSSGIERSFLMKNIAGDVGNERVIIHSCKEKWAIC